jgi:hypothetical protein
MQQEKEIKETEERIVTARRRKEQRWSSWDIDKDNPNMLRLGAKSTWPDTRGKFGADWWGG